VKGYEFNSIKSVSIYNLKSKGDVEKQFFGDFNARAEFFYEPSFEGASGFRIVRNSLDTSWVLEVKYVSNYNEAYKKASEKNLIMSNPLSIPEEIRDLIREYNRDRIKRFYEELHKLFKVETHSFPISDQFAEKLYKMKVSLIGNFKAKGAPPLSEDGYFVTFRTVVEDEVWSLNIHMPQDDALNMADIFRQIIADARTNKLDVSKYMTVLNTFEN